MNHHQVQARPASKDRDCVQNQIRDCQTDMAGLACHPVQPLFDPGKDRRLTVLRHQAFPAIQKKIPDQVMTEQSGAVGKPHGKTVFNDLADRKSAGVQHRFQPLSGQPISSTVTCFLNRRVSSSVKPNGADHRGSSSINTLKSFIGRPPCCPQLSHSIGTGSTIPQFVDWVHIAAGHLFPEKPDSPLTPGLNQLYLACNETENNAYQE